MPASNSSLMNQPADGTANAAVIVSLESFEAGVMFLHLRSTETLGAVGRLGDDGDGSSEPLGGDDEPPRFVLPVITRPYCDVDPHVVRLAHYTESLSRLASSSQVTVPFAEASTAAKPKEVLWEGRAFDDVVDDPVNYPNSKYRSCLVAWYRQLKCATRRYRTRFALECSIFARLSTLTQALTLVLTLTSTLTPTLTPALLLTLNLSLWS